jgi:beta-glucosidase-like glycosyl hydrolase
VITDALDMGGIVKGFPAGDAAVRALEAGADTLLMPADPEAAIRAVVAAVENAESNAPAHPRKRGEDSRGQGKSGARPQAPSSTWKPWAT